MTIEDTLTLIVIAVGCLLGYLAGLVAGQVVTRYFGGTR